MSNDTLKQQTGRIFDIQRWSLHDGPGIRTVVFLKGCPLRCLWCSNPESQEFYNELAFFSDKCIACHRCLQLCPNDAVKIENGRQYYDRTICADTCYRQGLETFPCTAQCYSKALRSVARVLTVDQVMNEVMKDEGIYKESGIGGVTVSGGEPLSQPEFVRNLFVAAKAKNITTAMETCGYSPWESFANILESTDFLYMDIKAFDPKLHYELTGTDNKQILQNAVKASLLMREHGKGMVVRIPVIPTLTRFEDFIMVLEFIKRELTEDTSVELMPYHRFGRNKYSDVGKVYALMDLEPLPEEELKPYRDSLASYSFKSL